MKKVPNLIFWLRKAEISGRSHLTVPPAITTLPCGHTRGLTDEPFLLKRNGKDWLHDFHGCEFVLVPICSEARLEPSNIFEDGAY